MRLRLNPFVRRAAAEAATLAAVFGSEDAAGEAIAAAVTRHEQVVIERIARQAETVAAAHESGAFDEGGPFVHALRWFAAKLRDGLGPDGVPVPYSPRDGDCIQLTFTGDLTEYQVRHPESQTVDTIWEFNTAEGFNVTLDPADFPGLDIAKLTGDEDE